jgi:hypothetical protein
MYEQLFVQVVILQLERFVPPIPRSLSGSWLIVWTMDKKGKRAPDSYQAQHISSALRAVKPEGPLAPVDEPCRSACSGYSRNFEAAKAAC